MRHCVKVILVKAAATTSGMCNFLVFKCSKLTKHGDPIPFVPTMAITRPVRL